MPFAHSSASPRRRTGAVANLHAIEESLHAHGYELIAGIDEAGRGPSPGRFARRRWCSSPEPASPA